MALLIYSLCAVTSAVCTYLLSSAYRRSRQKLLLWSAICFAGLTLNNLALWVDKLPLLEIDLSLWRVSIALLAMAVLLYGLIWDTE
ncbi:DUF5985 family protein [Bradyrhizobium sp.]|uniref:DUF5985 family protein n=1 Tax=Bradyrhizobium sp. TaxID=376 RepID=UPI0025C73324|nr:DUF5985 family protein [Bradyrhizobium sp.]